MYAIPVYSENIGYGYGCMWGILVLIIIVIIVLLSVFCCAQYDEELMTNLETVFKFNRKDIDKIFKSLGSDKLKKSLEKDFNLKGRKKAAKGFAKDIKRPFVENFAPVKNNQKISQPQVFKRQMLSVPGNCQPFMGCFYPSYLSNPINLRTAGRDKSPKENQIWCEKSWRDCNAYQDCVKGKCVPKKYPNVM